MKAETIYLQLTLAAPVHIGCGEVYEPMGFVVNHAEQELITFSPSTFMEQLTSDELAKLSAICKKGTVASIQELYKFMQLHKEYATGTQIAISKDFGEHYKEVTEKPSQRFTKELNKFEINRTFFNPIENTPVIPGSSIKGAIRTAVLSSRNNGASQPTFPGKNGAKRMEETLTGGTFKADPFRLVKVSDFHPIGEVKRKICYAVNLKKKPTNKDSSAIAQMQEIIEPGSKFWGSITLLPAPRDIRKPVNLAEITTALLKFYGTEKKREDRELQNISIPTTQLKTGANNFPLRLGRHSGAESVTIAGRRKIRIMLGHGNQHKTKNQATTIWLNSLNRKPQNLDGLQSMGWVTLKALSAQEIVNLKAAQQQAQATKEEQHKQQIQALAKIEVIRLQRQKEEEKRQQEEEKAQRTKEAHIKEMSKKWQKMTTTEQDIAIIKNEEIAHLMAPKHDILQNIWPKLVNAEEMDKQALAKAFSQLWQQEENKWRRKKCSASQWQKVKELVTIININHPDIQQLAPEDEEKIAQINTIKDWGQYQNNPIPLDTLTLPQALALATKLKEWGCNKPKKKTKPAKHKAWKNMQNCLKRLRGNHG